MVQKEQDEERQLKVNLSLARILEMHANDSPMLPRRNIDLVRIRSVYSQDEQIFPDIDKSLKP